MNIIRVTDLPVHTYGKSAELDECDIELLFRHADSVCYWYSIAPYEGDGAAILRKGEKFAAIELGHCSCYGPAEHENWNKTRWFDSLSDLLSNCDEVTFSPLVERMRRP